MPSFSAEAFGGGEQLRLGQGHDMAAVVINMNVVARNYMTARQNDTHDPGFAD